jgi:hypothetical protein
MIINGQSDIIYHADPAIGSTTAKSWLESPRLFRDELDGIKIRKDSRAFQFGRAGHMRYTDRALFDQLVSTGPVNEKTGRPYGAETKAYQEWSAANPGKIILSDRELTDLELMDQRMPSQVREILSDPDGVAESSFYVSLAGVAVKCRPDWMTDRCVYDIKTIGNMADAEKHISRYKYWFSHAWYRMIIKAETGQSLPFRFIFSEKNPPYRWRIIDIDADWIGYADATVDRVLGEIAEAQRTGDYSDRGDVCMVVEQPAWGDDAEFSDDENGGISL